MTHYVSTTYRPWHRLDVETFRQELRRSALCCSEIVPEDVDSMADLYNSELNSIVDRLLSLRTSTRRSRPSDPWFDVWLLACYVPANFHYAYYDYDHADYDGIVSYLLNDSFLSCPRYDTGLMADQVWDKFIKPLNDAVQLAVCSYKTCCIRGSSLKTRSSAIAEGPRDASCQLKGCQLPRNSAETTYTTSSDQIDGMKLEI